MAKQRLVDFRGGINKKISPHMIGDSQGQDGTNLDLSAVRLQGRFETDRLSANRAYGSFWYDSGVSTGRWVSKYQEDDSGTPNEPYIQYATDFAVWNRDLYVSLAGAASTGAIQVFRDGSSTPAPLAFDPPDAVTVEVDIENNSDTALIAAIPSQSATTQTVTVDVAGVNSNAAEFNYSQTGTANQQPYLTNTYETWQKTGDTTVYYRYSGDNLYERATLNTGNITVTIGDATKFDPYYYQDSGNHQEDGRYRWYKNGSSAEYWANGTSNTTPLTTRTSSQSSPITVTATNYNSYPWYDSATYTETTTVTTINSTDYYQWTKSVPNSANVTLYAAKVNNASSGNLKSLSSSTASAITVTTANYQSYSWSNGDTYNQDPASGTFAYGGNTYYKWFRNIAGSTSNTQELWALGNSGNLLERSSGTTSTTSLSSDFDNSVIFWRVTAVLTNGQISGYEVQAQYNAYDPGIISFSTKSDADAVTTRSGTTSQGDSFTLNRGSLISTASQNSSNSDLYYVSGSVTTTTYTFSNHTNTYIANTLTDHTNTYFVYSYTNATDNYDYYSYTGPKTEQRQVAYVPATPAYYYDDARSKLYIVKVTDTDVGDSSPAFSNGWLDQGRDLSLSGNGYYFRTVREVTNQYIPSLSQTYRLASLATNNSYIFGGNHSGGNYVHTPQRLTFNVTAPSSYSGSDPLVCYRLERRDSENTFDLCYFVPTSYDPTTGVPNFFQYDPSSTSTTPKRITLSNLDSTKTYTVSWVAYQDTKVSVNGSTSSSVSGSYEFAGNASPTPYFTLVNGADQRFLAADFRLSVRVIEPHPTNSAITGTFALTRCFDVFDLDDGNGTYLSGECDFLEGWPNGLGCGGLDSSGTLTGVPDYLKFLEESNNFFFGVGTDQTDTSYYGGGDNKAGSFLFVSDYNNPRNWDTGSYVQFDEEITGIHSYPGELIVWTKNATYRVFGSRPNEMRKIKLATTEGLLANEERSIALVGSYLVWVSQSGICFYDGSKVTNLTRGRFEDLDILNAGANIHASQFDDKYYVINGVTEKGYIVDFSLTGFPITKIDLNEDGTAKPTNSLSGTTYTPPSVLVYKPSENKLYSRRGIIEGNTGQRLPFNYTTRGFDGGAFGTLKLIRSVTINGNGNGNIRIYLDGRVISRDLSGYFISGAPVFVPTGENIGYWLVTSLQSGMTVSSTTTSFTINSITQYTAPNAQSEIIPGGVWEHPTTGTIYEFNSVATSTYNGVSYYSYKTISYDFPVTITSGLESEPKRVFLPASRTNAYGLPMADTWWVEVRDWNGIVDWIDTDYEIVAT